MRDHKEAPGSSTWIPGLGWQSGYSLGIASFLKKSLFYYSYPPLCDCSGLNGNTWFVLCQDCMLECLGFQALSLLLSHTLTPFPLSEPFSQYYCLSVCLSLSFGTFFFFFFVVVTAQCYVQNNFFVCPSLHPAIPMSKQFGISYVSLPPSELQKLPP